ncbi:MAG TPA: hypothetical protein PLL71_19080, partial [Agriterribacter sp.]|nr:hypothetical protein [Agriterribacter sp.]
MNLPTDLKEAIDKYLEGTASPPQQEMVNEWYCSFNDENVEVNVDAEVPGFKEQVELRIKQRIIQAIRKSEIKVVEMYPAPAGNRRKWLIAAACSIIALGTLWLLVPAEKGAVQYTTIQTSKGETRQVVLPDSSIVWLNAMSSIKY